VTLEAFLSPVGLAALLAWNFMVLAAIQLTVRLIMAFSVTETLRGALVLTVVCLPVALLFDLATGPDPSFGARLSWAWLPMVLMALGGYADARWVLRFKRVRGQVIAGLMGAVLAPHLFTLAPGLG
jgi:hypothetical protein